MRDITLGETVYFNFTTRAFATGIPTVLAGSQALSVLEENNATPITAGVSVEVDRASVVGLNQATIVATGGNGYEAGKGYSVYISTGTVATVSVVGEVVAQFTVSASAAATELANGTDGLTAIKAETALILADTAEIGTAGVGLSNIGTIATCTTVTNAIVLPTIPTDFITADGIATDAIDAAAVAADAIDLIWDETLAGHVTADTTGLLLNEWQPSGRLDVVLAARMAEASIDTTGGAVDLVTTTTTATNLTNAATSGDLTATMKTSVLAQADAAIDTTTYAEPAQGLPPATDTIAGKIGMLAKTLRNKKTSTATTISIFNDDASTVDHKRTISDDATTYTEGEIETGP